MRTESPGFLSGKVVFITGGSRGIGRAISLRLAQENPAHIMIAYCMNADAARRTLHDLQECGVQASVVVCDVGNPEMQRQVFKRIDEEFGRLDVFIANAARTTFRSAVPMDLRSWRRTQELNSEAFLVGSQLAAAIMRRNGGGRIIGLSSLGSRYYIPNYAALGAAKAVMENLARYLAVELAPDHINVNVLCGGFIDTESMKMHPDYYMLAQSIAARTPAGRLGQPQDLAGVAAFLCSPESEWIRGQTIIADGGFSLAL
jgi:enoyl-[acyl-carrier protein] reductase III